MSSTVSIIMYHYVRDLQHSRYPDIKGLDLGLFKEQIAYIQKHYNVISAYTLMDAIEHRTELPPRALLLTFDDGYLDHFTCVYPVLDALHLPAVFSPPAKSIQERRVLNVNKIHFILASVPDKNALVQDIYACLDENRTEYGLQPNAYYWQKHAKPGRYDPAEIVFIKRMLQRELPEPLRETLINRLFAKYVSKDETAFAAELYMSLEQIAHLQRNGMYVGSHGFAHDWLNYLSPSEQEKEIDLALQFLQRIGSDPQRWIMCYPYGGYDNSLLNILQSRGCIAGLTTEVGIADLAKNNPLTLPRLNTNDLPKNANAAPNTWTLKA